MYDRNERIAALETLLAEHALDGNLARCWVPVLVRATDDAYHLPSSVPDLAKMLVGLVARSEATEAVVVDVVCWVAGLADQG